MAAIIPRTPGPRLQPREQLVLSRATFGATPETRADLLESGWEAWLDEQLDPDAIQDDDLDAMVAGYDTLHMTNAELGTLRRNQVGQAADQRIVGELMHNTFLRARWSRRQLHEVLVDFWTNHLNVYLFDKPLYRHLHVEYDQRVIRPHAVGRFADLLAASAGSPAMLVYLDNYLSDANSAAGVNENYGRELLELHTLGIIDGVQPYGEDDLVVAAKALSGWSIDSDGQNDIFFRYRDAFHSTESLSILDGAWTTDGSGGHQDGMELIDVLAHHELTSRYVAWKLCQRFVADDPPETLVESAAQVFLDNDTAIGPVVRHIFHSGEFEATLGGKLRRPFDLVAGAFRAAGAVVDPDPIGPASQLLHADIGALAVGGQRLFSHRPPDGYPDTAEDWVSADGMLRRWELAGRLMNGRLGPIGAISVDIDDLLPAHRPPTAGEYVDALANRLLLVGDAVPRHRFGDVPAWVNDAVSWLTWMAVAEGYTDNTYRPDNPITRAEITNWLWQLADQPTGHPAHGFTDVPRWITTAVNWLTDIDIADGYTDNTYRPDNPITRAEITNWLWGLYHKPTRTLTDEDREPLVDRLGGEDHAITGPEVDAAQPDLLALVLATPSFQYR